MSASGNSTKVSFSTAGGQHLRECFDEILDAAASQSVRPKMAAIMEDVFVKVDSVEKVGGDIGKHKKKRKNPRTTLYILTSVYLILPCS